MTGEVQGTNGPRSSEQMKVASATLASNVITAVVDVVSPPSAGSPGVSGAVNAGPSVIVVMMPPTIHT